MVDPRPNSWTRCLWVGGGENKEGGGGGVSRVGLGLHAKKVQRASRRPSIGFELATSGVSQF